MRSTDRGSKKADTNNFSFPQWKTFLLLKVTAMLIYLYFKVWKVERGPEQRAEVRYGGDFPPGLDLFHRNGTSLGHFRTWDMVWRLLFTLEGSFLGDLESLRNITSTTKVASVVLVGQLPLRPEERYNLFQSESRRSRTDGKGDTITRRRRGGER